VRREWFFRFLLLVLIGRLCFNEKTVTAARTSYVTTAILWLTCPARHTAVRWKLYSSYYYYYYYMFYFRFSFPISNTYHARTRIYYYINSMQHTHTHTHTRLRAILSVYRSRIIKSEYIGIYYICVYNVMLDLYL